MYKEYDDQELMYLIGERNENAEEILYEKYKNLVNIKAKKYINYGKKIGLDYNDLFQEGMIGLSEAIKSYKDKSDTKFSTFATLCIDRQIFSVLEAARRKKHLYLNESCSLDSTIFDDGKTLLDVLFDNNSDPSLKIEELEMSKLLHEDLEKELTPFEKEVFNLKLAGFEYKEICKLLNKSYKSVDSALQRIKNKVRKVLENNK